MSDLDRRWKRLVAAARRAPTPERTPPAAAWVERVARQGLRARAAPPPRAPERLAWAGLSALAAAATTVLLLSPGPIAATTTAIAARLVALPRSLPHAPRLPPPPAPPRPALPPARSTLAAVARWPELTKHFPFTSRRTETP